MERTSELVLLTSAPASESRRSALCDAYFDGLLGMRQVRIPRLLRAALPIWLTCCGVGMITGSGVASFRITIEGLVGALTGTHASTDYTIASLAGSVASVTPLGSQGLLYALQLGFIVTAMVIPVVGAGLCGVLWSVRLRPRTQRALVVACEVCSAWAMLEVFAVILLTSLLSLDQFAKFSLGDECNSINALLQGYPELARLVEQPDGSGEDTCLGIVPTLLRGYYVFAAASLLCVPATAFVTHVANVALEERALRANKDRDAITDARRRSSGLFTSTATRRYRMHAPAVTASPAVPLLHHCG
jgi:hypothetical protein